MSENKLDIMAQDDAETTDAETAADHIAQQIAPPAPDKPSPLMWLGLGGLGIVALLVIFVLPAIVSEYELPLQRREAVVSQNLPVPADSPTAISPFEQAQLSQQRKAAQDALAELLEIKAELELLEVEAWGQDSYAAAVEEATAGDEFYRARDYLLATESYARGRDTLKSLQGSIPDLLQGILTDAQNALAAADAETALRQFALALRLEADSEAASIGLERARVMEDVVALLAEADDLLEDGDLTAARNRYQQVLDLDRYNEEAPERLAVVQSQLVQIEFARLMSEGYTFLEAEDPQLAIASFRRAASLGINRSEAEAAITQTETAVANAQINALRNDIDVAEASERWADAVAAYDEVLAIDPNILFATEGRVHANQRANLDAFLLNAINNPERLAEDEVYQQTRGYYLTARNLSDPGPRLESQLDELEQLLLNSQISEEIQLVSDSLTDVTLLRVGQLGKFQQQSLTLKPGRYVLVGKRIGYRDVRTEFVVGFGQSPDTVEIRCVERVVASSGQ